MDKISKNYYLEFEIYKLNNKGKNPKAIIPFKVKRRWKARPYKLPIIPDLPDTRIRRSRTFERIALDYMGPISIKSYNGSSMSKKSIRKNNRVNRKSSEIGRRLLLERDLLTPTTQMEGILNTRSLTCVNFDDYALICPIDFILPGSSLMLLTPNNNEEIEFILVN
ncbi:unnamed protein product [Onchocerca flexuosa]|uniref:Uncharacterized protein n=1 Tax=Onchocerca flexuosa TaxID=387005 RepID=A0A183GXU0_9BILA|nr:unnamed protein product [Onchocerca flexuosa]